jgi:zinc transport system permease protein
MRVFRSFRAVTICSACLSVFCTLSGMLIAVAASTPVGATIVAADMAAFALFSAVGALRSA